MSIDMLPNKWGFYYIRGSNCILCLLPEAEDLFKRKTINSIQGLQ